MGPQRGYSLRSGVRGQPARVLEDDQLCHRSAPGWVSALMVVDGRA